MVSLLPCTTLNQRSYMRRLLKSILRTLVPSIMLVGLLVGLSNGAATANSGTTAPTVASADVEATVTVDADADAAGPAATSLRCSTGGYWYQTDSFYTTKKRVNGVYEYSTSWSGNRELFVGHPYYDYWKHTLRTASIKDSNGIRYQYWSKSNPFKFTSPDSDADLNFAVQLNMNNGQVITNRTCRNNF